MMDVWQAWTIASSSWMLTYLAHSTALLGAAWLAARALGKRLPAVQETLWKTALVAGVVTATGQWASEPGNAAPAAANAAATQALESPVPIVDVASSELAAPPTAAKPAETNAAFFDWSGIARQARPWMAAAWPIVAGVLCLWLIAAYAGLARRLRGRRAIEDGPLADSMARLARERHIPKIRLSQTAGIRTPMAMGLARREICLPERALRELDADQQEAMLAHETAHHVYGDPAWLLLSRFLESALFFQPLNRLARKRAQDLAELRCDDWAAERTGQPLALARCLTEVAAWSARPAAALAPGMAHGGGALRDRVSRLAAQSPRKRLPKWTMALAAVCLCLTVAAAPNLNQHVPAPPSPPAEPAPVAPAAEPRPPSVPTETAPTTPPKPAAMPRPAAQPSPSAQPAPVAPPSPTSRPWSEDAEDREEEAREARLEALEARLELALERFEGEVEVAEARLESYAEAWEARVEARLEDREDEAGLEALEARLERMEDEIELEVERFEASFEAMEERFEDELDLLEDLPAAQLDAEFEKLSANLDQELGRLRGELQTLVDGLMQKLKRMEAGTD